MSEVVDSYTLRQDLLLARDGMIAASKWSQDAAVDKPRAEIAYETAYAHAYIGHKESGATDALAKQKATIDTTVERQKFYELKEALMVAKAELHAWGSLFDAYRTVGFVAQQEAKFAGVGA